jgi:hypothetical protein
VSFFASRFAVVLLVSLSSFFLFRIAAASDGPSYFLMDGNPVAVKYASGKLERLPVQDADSIEALGELESVSALMKRSHLTWLSAAAEPLSVQISSPRLAEYGVPMFAVSAEGSAVNLAESPALVWSGTAQFREVVLDLPGSDTQLTKSLITQSHRVLMAKLDFLAGKRIELDGPAKVKDFGRTSLAPHLAFVDVSWRIKNFPAALANHGIDSLPPFLRVKYVVDKRTGRVVFRSVTNEGSVDDRGMRLFKEARGPLMMAVMISCVDGAEPLIIDLEHETYGTGRLEDVPEIAHCFPAH